MGSLFFTSRSLVNNHLIAILWTLGTRLPRPFTLCIPSPNRTGVFVALRFTTSTTVRVITPTKKDESPDMDRKRLTNLFIAIPRTFGLRPNHRLLPAFPKFRFFHSGLLTFPIVAQHSCNTFRTSPLCSL